MGAQICQCYTFAPSNEFEVMGDQSTSAAGVQFRSTEAPVVLASSFKAPDRPTKMPSIVRHLSDKQKRECKEAFARFATIANTPDQCTQQNVPASCTGQGTIMTKEFRMVLRSLGHNPVEEELEELLEGAGVCGSDTIDLPTFVCMVAQLLEEDTSKTEREALLKPQTQPSMDPDVQELIAHFEAVDTDRTGFIKRAQMPQVLAAIGDGNSNSFFEENVDGDGRINYRELVKAFRSG